MQQSPSFSRSAAVPPPDSVERPSILALLQRHAADPGTPLQQLRGYAKTEALRPFVAANPNIDTRLLLELGAEYPEQVLANPMLLLKLATDPDFALHLRDGVHGTTRQGKALTGILPLLLPLPECPQALIEEALQHPEPRFLRALLANPSLEPATLLRIEEVVRNHRYSTPRMRDIRRHAHHPKPGRDAPLDVLLEALRATTVAPALLVPYLHQDDPDPRVVNALAEHNAAAVAALSRDPETLRMLHANARDELVLLRLAANSHTPPDVVRELLFNGDAKVVSTVLHRTDVHPEDLQHVLRNGSWRARSALLGDTALPAALLREAVSHNDLWPQLATHPNTPPDVLELLVARTLGSATAPTRQQEQMLERIAAHPATPPQALRALFDRFQRLLLSGIMVTLAQHPALPGDLRQRFITAMAAFRAHAAVASNPALTPDEAWTLAVDPDAGVRRNLADNPATPTELLEALLDDPDPATRIAAGRRLQLDTRTLVPAEDEPTTPVRRALERGKARDLLACALRPDLTPDEMLELAKHPHANVRLAVALNPTVASEVLAALQHDVSLPVRRAVRDRLRASA